MLYENTGVPIVFDYHHHTLRSSDLTTEEAMMLAFDTWPRQVTPVVHYSSSKKIWEDPLASPAAHADFIYEHIDLFGRDVDIMLEAKAKELATLKFRVEQLAGKVLS